MKTGSSTKRFAASVAAAVAALFTAPPGLAQVPQQLPPNLTALPASDISTVINAGGDPELRFSASSWNGGTGPLELIAGEVAQGRQNVYQRLYSGDGSFVDILAGDFTWHQGHNHFHFDDYALYTLQSVKGTSQRSSTKTSFCIMDTAAVNLALPGAPGNAIYAQCGNSVQGMSVGWGDTYGAYLAGQEIGLKRLKSGDYRLIIEADPQNHLLEADETDNVSCVLLRINVSSPSVSVLNPNNCDPPPPPVVARIEPAMGLAGAAPFPVTITGTGFAAGMAVTFENGNGYKPVASNVVFVDSTKLTATVTIRKKGPAGTDHLWDLRVGPGVLLNAFTVQP